MRTDFSGENHSSATDNVGMDDDDSMEPRPAVKQDLNLLVWLQSGRHEKFGRMIEGLFQGLPIFKDIFLILRPVSTWNHLVANRGGAGFTFVFYLLPMLLLTAMIEGHGLLLLGRQQVARGMNNRFTLPKVCAFEIGSLLLLLALIVVIAAFIKVFANACHARNRLSQSLVVMFHAVGPMLAIQWFNGIPHIYLWLTWLVGASLSIAALYQGLPRIMNPDPPSAMGLFVGSAMASFLVLLCWRILTGFYLAGELRTLEKHITDLVG